MKLLYRVIERDIELYKGNKNQVTSWLRDRSDISGLIVVKVGGSLEYTVDEFLSNMVPLTAKYSIITDFGPDSEVLFSSSSEDRIVEWLKKQSDVTGWKVFVSSEPTGRQYMTVDRFLNNYIIPRFYTQLVHKYYTMDPKTEDMLPDGRHLANGMKVLIADADNRGRPESMEEDWERERVMRNNRWCTVTHLETVRNTVSFIGVYEDETKIKRFTNGIEAWLVKIDSIPDLVLDEEKEAERTSKIQDLVQDAMTAAVKVVTGEASDEVKADQLTNKIHEATAAILGALG